jgi:aminoglycoside/choline kinase family phosphotransferase
MAARQLIASAESLTVTQLTGDASTRSYFRVRSEEASLIVTLYDKPFDETEPAADRLARFEAENPSARLTFANDPCAHIEVTELFLEAGLPVPPILAVSGGEGVLFIEDVGDMKLQDWLPLHTDREIAAAYADAIELIVNIQEATALSSGSICSRLAFDEMKLKWELGFFFANYFNRYLGLRLDGATANGVQSDFKAICSELAARPRVLTHRDYHARNLMMKEGEMFIIDHQDARMGPAAYDLASLVSDPYTGLDREIANNLVEQFIRLKAESNVPLDDEKEFRRELELMTLQRMLKAVGTYSYQAAVANKTIYAPYIAPAIERALAAIRSIGRFESTCALLERTRAGDR